MSAEGRDCYRSLFFPFLKSTPRDLIGPQLKSRMKIEDLLFAMCDDNNDYLDDSNSPIKCGSHESDEGCCIISPDLLSPSSSSPGGGGLGSGGGESIRRVKSTPNLLQIPSPHRHRKRSDDSAVGSAEETESSRSNDSLSTGGEPSPSKKIYSSYRHSCPQDTSSSSTPSSASSTASSSFKNPSCITQHHPVRILTPTLPLFVTDDMSRPAKKGDKFRRSISTTGCSRGGASSASNLSSVSPGSGVSRRTPLTASFSQISSGSPGPSDIYNRTSSSSTLSVTTPTSPAGPPTFSTNFGPFGGEGKLLRPPSVVISDHDLCQEEGETYITLEELDAEFNQQKNRRRFSDCSTCSSLSFSESDLTALSNEEESEEAAVNRVSGAMKHF